jgi:hypothetical protein
MGYKSPQWGNYPGGHGRALQSATIRSFNHVEKCNSKTGIEIAILHILKVVDGAGGARMPHTFPLTEPPANSYHELKIVNL